MLAELTSSQHLVIVTGAFPEIGIEIDAHLHSKCRLNANPEAREILFAFAQELLRLGQRDFVETNEIAGPKLRGNRQVHRDHVSDFRITTDGLAITEQENRLLRLAELAASRA